MEGKHGRSSGSGTTLGGRNERGGLHGTRPVMGPWVVEAADERSWWTSLGCSRASEHSGERQSKEEHRNTHRHGTLGCWKAKRARGADNWGPAGRKTEGIAPRWAPSHTTYLLRPSTSPGTGLLGREREVRAGGPAAPVLTTGSAVLDGDGGLLLALGFLPLALVAVGAAVAGAERPVGAVAREALAGAAGGAAAVQADPVELALVLAFVCKKGIGLQGSPRGRRARGEEGGRALPFPRGLGYSPWCWHCPDRTFWMSSPRRAPERPITHSLSYVTPSSPHTGSRFGGQFSGRGSRSALRVRGFTRHTRFMSLRMPLQGSARRWGGGEGEQAVRHARILPRGVLPKCPPIPTHLQGAGLPPPQDPRLWGLVSLRAAHWGHAPYPR